MQRDDYDAHYKEMEKYIGKYIKYRCPVQKTFSEHCLLAISGSYAMISEHGGLPSTVHAESIDPVSPERQIEIDKEHAAWEAKRAAEEEERIRMQDPVYRGEQLRKSLMAEMGHALDRASEEWFTKGE